MTEHVVHVQHAYGVTYVPRGGRNPRDGVVLGSAPVTVAECAREDAPLAIKAQVIEKWHMGANPPTVSKDFHAVAGRTSVYLAGADGVPVGIEALEHAGVSARHKAWSGTDEPFEVRSDTGAVPLEDLNAKRLVTSDEAAAREKLAEAAARTRLVDGALLVPSAEPVWAVYKNISYGGPSRLMVFPCLKSDPQSQYHPTFRADNLDGAMAYANWIAGRLSETLGRESVVEVSGGIEVLDPSVLSHDEAAVNAERLIERAGSHQSGDDFAALPIPALVAWIDFRKARELHVPGDLRSALPCVEALARMYQALPRKSDCPEHRTDRTSVTLLNLTLMEAPFLDALWSGLVPAHSADDEAALGSLRI